MKTKFTSLLLILMAIFSHQCAQAQGIYQMWGTTSYGGEHNKGVLFTTKHDGSGYHLKKSFTVSNPGAVDSYNKPSLFNTKFYCATADGGLNDNGIIAEYAPSTNTWVKKVDLNTIDGSTPQGSLTLYNGKFYGVCLSGGLYDEGLLFEYDPVSNVLLKRYDFSPATGSYPREGLTLYNSKFYGVTISGGTFDDGVIYEFDPATLTYTNKASFSENVTGYCSYGTKLIAYNNLLWGSTNFGGAGNGAAIFSFNPLTNALLKKVEVQTIGSTTLNGSLTLMNGKFYGGTSSGGTNGSGVIFEYNPATNVLIPKYSLSYTSGRHNLNFTFTNNLLYTCSAAGGANNLGQLFSFNPVNNQYTAIVDLNGSNGDVGAGNMLVYNNKLWGFTKNGGSYGSGSLFSYDLTTTVFNTMVHLGGSELYFPTGPLMYYNDKLYGTCDQGGLFETYHSIGGIYEYDPSTDQYTVKINLHDSIGNFYDQGGFTLLNNKFYAVTSYGGNTNEGSLIEYDPISNQVTKKHDFTFSTGNRPFGRLGVYNGKLYGTCSDGSTNGIGNVFEFNPATGVYAQKVILDQAKGAKPYGTMVWYNNKFYGVCANGGSNFDGTLFEYNPAINSYVKKVDLDSATGKLPFGGLTEWNGKLYGTTMYGGNVDSGTIFEYNPLTVTYTKKVDLNSVKGVQPGTTLTLLNNKLYGMTQGRGASNCGTLFQFDTVGTIFTKKLDFTPATGKRARSNQLVPVPALTAPGSANSCNNTQTITINATNANKWIAFTDAQGRAVAEMNANGNILGNTSVRFYVNSGSLRQDGSGAYYLDRNLTITPSTQPTTSVSVRLYIRKAEFDAMAAVPASGVTGLSDLQLVKNTDFCSSSLVATTTPFASTYGNWATDYVYTCNPSSLGSFYFIGPVPVINTTVNVKLFIQDYYSGSSLMKPVLSNQNVSADMSITDSIEVALHSAFLPFGAIASTKTVLNINGTALCHFPMLTGSFYIVVTHRNGLQTWSASPVSVGAVPASYDFSMAASAAYGTNQVQVDPGVWAIYSGDLNDDENIDLLDGSILETDINNFVFGYYATDINGDGNVDLLDTSTLETNINQFVFSSHP